MFDRPDEQEQTSVYWKKYIFSKSCYFLLVSFITCRCLFKSLALLIQWLVFLLSIVYLALLPFFLKVLGTIRAFNLLKDGCLNSPHFNMILLGSKIKTNRKKTDYASEILFTVFS